MIDLGHPLVVGLLLVLAGAGIAFARWFLLLVWKLTNAVEALSSSQDSHDDRITDLEKWRDETKDRTIQRLESEKKALELQLAEAKSL